MKMDYDLICCGEGITGLITCSLLAEKGIKCLWVDNSPTMNEFDIQSDIPHIITQAFFDDILEPVLSRLGHYLIKSLRVEKGLSIRYIGSEDNIDCEFSRMQFDYNKARKCREQYSSLLIKSLSKPKKYLRELRTDSARVSGWEGCVGPALSSYEAGRMAHTKALVSLLGMCSFEFGTIKNLLISYLQRHQGSYLHQPDAMFVDCGDGSFALKLKDRVLTCHCYLTDNPPGQLEHNGFHLFCQCRARLAMIPQGLGDLVLLSTPDELTYPILVKVVRDPENPRISIQTRVNVEHGLNSNTEIISWASGMITKKLSRSMPFLSSMLRTLEIVNPLTNDTIRPWFRFSENIEPPSFFNWKRYISPEKRIFACDRDKFTCLGGDGDFFWGICIANAVLKELGRSDIIVP